MACGPQRSATCNGNRSSCPRAACTFTGSRTESPVCTQSAVTRCGRCASYAAITRKTPTYSLPSVADQSAPSASIASSSVSGRPPRCHSRSTHTCFAMPAGLSWPTMATTRAPCSTTSGTRTFSTRSGTPKWLPIGSKIFGKTERYAFGSISRSAASMPPWHPVRSRPRWRSHLARSALPRADRGVGLHHQEVRPALALWLKPSPDGLRLGSRERGRPRRPFNDFRRLIGLSREHGLDDLDGLLDLLVGHRLDGTRGMLELHLLRHQHRADLQIRSRRLAPHPLEHLSPMLLPILRQIEQKAFVERSARCLWRAARVSRMPRRE